MKKLLFTLAALAIVVGASAQKKSSDKVIMGFKVGLNLSDITHINQNYKPSVLVGFYTEYRLANWFSLQPEVVYSKQGSMRTFDGVQTRLRANYLNIPVMMKFYVMPRLSLDLGPQLGLNLGTKIKMDNGKNDTAVQIISNDFYNTCEFSIAAGITYQKKRGPAISVRYNMGVSNVFKNKALDISNRNSVLQVAFGWTY